MGETISKKGSTLIARTDGKGQPPFEVVTTRGYDGGPMCVGMFYDYKIASRVMNLIEDGAITIEQTSRYFIIRDNSDNSLAWNNTIGWVGSDIYTVFTEEETKRFNLPTGGRWVQL